MNKVVLICGDRDWINHDLIKTWIDKLLDMGYDTLVEGEARGADSSARLAAEEAGMSIMYSAPGVRGFPAEWNKYHKAAGPIRNYQMLVEGKPDLVLAFHNDIKNSKGTRNMVEQTKAFNKKLKINIKIIIIKENGNEDTEYK